MDYIADLDSEIQEASLCQLQNDYPNALVRHAILRADKKQFHLFGWVELFPFDMIVPEGWTAGAKPWAVPGTDGWTLTFSTTRVSSEVATDWYRRAARGSVNIITPKGEIPTTAAAMAAEPNLGKFAVGMEAPFAFPWHDSPRINQLVPMTRPQRQVLKLTGNDSARHWLQENLGFDPFEEIEWLGGLAMLAPDPILASLQISPCARPENGTESLSCLAVPRRTRHKVSDLSTLTLHVIEERGNGWASIQSTSLAKEGFTELQYPQLTDKIGWALVCSERGLLQASKPASWLNQISFGLQSSVGSLEIEVPSGGKRKPAQSYQQSRYSSGDTSTIGVLPEAPGRLRLQSLVSQRKKRDRRKSAPQKIFGTAKESLGEVERNRKKKEAQDFVVGLIKEARRRLIFVDPFFGVREMRLFALQNQSDGLVPRILTGLPALKSLSGEGQGFQLQQGIIFASDLEDIRNKLEGRAPTVRVMPGGEKTLIHDRYLVVDEDVWHCGPSFNELGERLGVMTKLPEPVSIRSMIGKVWLQSTDLAELSLNARKT
ncbi:hypothetical protein GCM10007094_13150 [Pseudovibrio japonicus]|uniref:Uncharacterized protein n=1 Tax=Pseudovibrio japonicus TaxID=366534 RepID=A0ABQ3E4N6_9HYPH|nr:VPA1262 family N-terminal domain-containing protein [Pseudovibrio japonicus]GHB26309.1 hypothetical protein GCM10007094_13150 [Pseudovibrio japonicus]